MTHHCEHPRKYAGSVPQGTGHPRITHGLGTTDIASVTVLVNGRLSVGCEWEVLDFDTIELDLPEGGLAENCRVVVTG